MGSRYDWRDVVTALVFGGVAAFVIWANLAHGQTPTPTGVPPPVPPLTEVAIGSAETRVGVPVDLPVLLTTQETVRGVDLILRVPHGVDVQVVATPGLSPYVRIESAAYWRVVRIAIAADLVGRRELFLLRITAHAPGEYRVVIPLSEWNVDRTAQVPGCSLDEGAAFCVALGGKVMVRQ